MEPKPGQIWYYNMSHWLVLRKRPTGGYDIYCIRNGATTWSYITGPQSSWKLIQDVP